MPELLPKTLRPDTNAFLPTAAGDSSQFTATFLIGETGRIQAFDAEAERLFHCRAGDVIGESIFTLLPTFPLTLLKPSGKETLSSRILRLDACPKDGSKVPVEMTLTSVTEGGKVLDRFALRPSAQQTRGRKPAAGGRDLPAAF